MTRHPLTAPLLALAACGLLLGGCADEQPGRDPGPGLERTVVEFARGLLADAAYRPPTASERAGFTAALDLAAEGEDDAALRAFAEFGYSYDSAVDPDTGRRYAIAVQEPGGERSWGLYLVDRTEPVRVVVEVPHPNYDLGTEEVGLALFRAAPGAVLAIAGTHRGAANGAGDVAHRTESMFHAVATGHADRGLPQVQLHGFADTSRRGTDVVLSPGAGEVSEPARRAADLMADTGLRVCRSWARDCGNLEGGRNAQGVHAAEARAVFLHVEINRSVRDDRERWGEVVTALAAALR